MDLKKQRGWTWVIAIFFVGAGANHFFNPAPYLSMMPSYLPEPRELVWISGIAEIFGGIGVLVPSAKKLAGWGLILLLLAIFPANLNVAVSGWPGVNLPGWVLWVRLPLQVLMIWAVHHVILAGKAQTKTNA